MARIYPLFSSSSGNCTYIGNGKSGILIDAGVSCKRICDSLEANGLEAGGISGIFITHTHSDHVSGLKVLAKKLGIPIYAQRKNLSLLMENDLVPENAQLHELDSGETICGDFSLTHFETPHDTPASCGYRIICPDGKKGVSEICSAGGENRRVESAQTGAGLLLQDVGSMLWKALCVCLPLLQYPHSPVSVRRIREAPGDLSSGTVPRL